MDKKIVYVVVIILIVLFSMLISYRYYDNLEDSKREYSIDITITPEKNESFFVYMPVITFDNGEMLDYSDYITSDLNNVIISKVTTKYGDAINISSDTTITIKTNEPVLKEYPGLAISLENNNDTYLGDRGTTFNIYMNSSNNSFVNISYEFSVTTDNDSYFLGINIEGTLTNEWNQLNGTINVHLD